MVVTRRAKHHRRGFLLLLVVVSLGLFVSRANVTVAVTVFGHANAGFAKCEDFLDALFTICTLFSSFLVWKVNSSLSVLILENSMGIEPV